jgi:uncharacterized membrane protein YtjA (UPF0391 family)
VGIACRAVPALFTPAWHGLWVNDGTRFPRPSFSKEDAPMLHYALVFLVIAIIAAVLGFGGIAGAAAGIAKILFVIFLILAIIAFFRRAS